ncbi:phosphoribosylaminoimidazolesuccinocarboxamide synthase [Desulfonatronovibrio hydrogenovorans]|uniref:phosphoribosylaminoimidazolesuccinocarboxamide synthase n=1 Tax=Desulfonatronovibrio hydrogenovorans TaxID=53245 RepID=UPI000491FFF8|nr:phosphoribosylaminoimidazolesuccinocarboxamide synthase [Desulfonatronovibrio hydrogenovorans]
MKVVAQTSIKEYPLLSRGKVRDIYEIDPSTLLIVTTDRMSAFDVVMNEPIPFKGAVLNQITLFWMEMFQDIVENHLITPDVDEFPKDLEPYREELEGRSVLVKKAKPLPIECIVRGYITGSGWKDYRNTGKVCGYDLPEDLVESQKLQQPLFTPSTKADVGDHDENITLNEARLRIGDTLAGKVEELSMAIYAKGRDYAAQKGIIVADTKFEFGEINGRLVLIDEVLTPDSSRFWPADRYEPGKSQPSFDKQYLRDWLETTGWDKKAPAPALPREIIEETGNKYLLAYRLLTGKNLV